MATDEDNEHLEHYGVKGMRWGVRRRVGSDGTVTGKKAKPKPSTDFKTTAPYRNKPPYALTNLQLKKVNERQQLESKYKQMNPTTADRGKRAVDDVLKASIGAGLSLAAVAKLLSDPKNRELVRKGAQAVQAYFKTAKPVVYPMTENFIG